MPQCYVRKLQMPEPLMGEIYLAHIRDGYTFQGLRAAVGLTREEAIGKLLLQEGEVRDEDQDAHELEQANRRADEKRRTESAALLQAAANGHAEIVAPDALPF